MKGIYRGYDYELFERDSGYFATVKTPKGETVQIGNCTEDDICSVIDDLHKKGIR